MPVTLRWIVLAMLTAAAAAAFPAPPQSREEALAALAHADAATRAEGVVWIANRGTMADAPLLHERLRDDSAFVRSFAERGLWLLWSRSGDAEVDGLMARGTEAMQAGRHGEAIETFTRIIESKPEFAEGWNRRATVYYLDGQHDRSIADCAEVLKRNPGHFGALSGLGQIYLALEQYESAAAWFRRALEVNPNMVGVEMQLRLLEEKLKAPPGGGRAT